MEMLEDRVQADSVLDISTYKILAQGRTVNSGDDAPYVER
jgi:hypothetical protein